MLSFGAMLLLMPAIAGLLVLTLPGVALECLGDSAASKDVSPWRQEPNSGGASFSPNGLRLATTAMPPGLPPPRWMKLG
jgi:hypothetical protein